MQMEINSLQWFVLPSAVDLVTYITRFQWDMAKYPIKQSLKNISEIISKVSQPQQTLLLILMSNLVSGFCLLLSYFFLLPPSKQLRLTMI